jgi:hypothetical protein
MALQRNDLFRREAEGMSEESLKGANSRDDVEQILSVDEEELPGLLEEKRRREELSRQIAFGEGL